MVQFSDAELVSHCSSSKPRRRKGTNNGVHHAEGDFIIQANITSMDDDKLAWIMGLNAFAVLIQEHRLKGG